MKKQERGHVAQGRAAAASPARRAHKPHLDEMHGPESLPYRAKRRAAGKTVRQQSRIIQPTDSRQSGPEFGPSPRSTGGTPGKRGGWKKR